MSASSSPYSYTYDTEKADEIWARLSSSASENNLPLPDRDICGRLFGNSPFLSGIAERDPVTTLKNLTAEPDISLKQLLESLQKPRKVGEKRDDLSAFLRRAKAEVSLIVAYADVSEIWSLDEVTNALSSFADAALQIGLAHLLHESMTKGDLPWPSGRPEAVSPNLAAGCGYFVLGMGKLGAHELNYSSDIDLIALFDPQSITYHGKKTLAQCWIKITQDLMQLIEQRTMYGYVFRTDLRLRPDPGATPVAITVDAAESYYHSMAVNWERSAMIKARIVAGDETAGERYLDNLSSWVWRRNMDFAALKDIAAIKNQINRHYEQDREAGPGFDVKLGHGGIREIEFFAQVNQLLHAGRHPELRVRGTKKALSRLSYGLLINENDRQDLSSAYDYLRTLEHRIQMIDDAQTHELPANDNDIERVATFMGEPSASDLFKKLADHTDKVRKIYDGLLPDYDDGPTSQFSEKDLPKTLERLGFQNTDVPFAMIEGWRRGRHQALRTQRAKDLLEQCLPKLLEALTSTDNPEAALIRFDKFLSRLPTGVQLFSLLHSNPSLFKLLARVMGLAPALAEILAKKPELWDMVLEPSFYAPIEDEVELRSDLENRLKAARDFQDILDFVRKFVAEQKFRAGVHLLESLAGVEESGEAMTRVADTALQTLVPHVAGEFARRHGEFPGGGIAILAMGKYGGRELTHTSDLDIVFLYHAEDMTKTSDGTKPLMPSQYFSRLGQNIITAITALTSEGRLFEVDTRLRPSGSQGPLVVTLQTFQDYYAQSAWTWEHMALTRARVILAPDAMREKLVQSVTEVLVQPRNQQELLRAVHDMRGKLYSQFGTTNQLAIKHCKGGLVDLEFICQYLMLKDGFNHPEVFEPEISKAISKLQASGQLSEEQASTLEHAHQIMQKTQSLLRLSVGSAPASLTELPSGLKSVLMEATNSPDIETFENRLTTAQQSVYKLYCLLIETPAKQSEATIGDAK